MRGRGGRREKERGGKSVQYMKWRTIGRLKERGEKRRGKVSGNVKYKRRNGGEEGGGGGGERKGEYVEAGCIERKEERQEELQA